MQSSIRHNPRAPLRYKNGAAIRAGSDAVVITRDGVALTFTRAEVERNTQARGADRGFWAAVLAWMDGGE